MDPLIEHLNKVQESYESDRQKILSCSPQQLNDFFKRELAKVRESSPLYGTLKDNGYYVIITTTVVHLVNRLFVGQELKQFDINFPLLSVRTATKLASKEEQAKAVANFERMYTDLYTEKRREVEGYRILLDSTCPIEKASTSSLIDLCEKFRIQSFVEDGFVQISIDPARKRHLRKREIFLMGVDIISQELRRRKNKNESS